MIKTLIRMEAYEKLMPTLKGRVFHVTPSANMQAIEHSGAILPNQNSEWDSLYGNSVNGFFRLKGCVSFFDYRNYGTKEWEAHAHKCTPTQILRHANSISILFLCESQFDKLETWKKWREEEKWSQRVVPHIEAGYPGPVKLEYISEQLVVEYASR